MKTTIKYIVLLIGITANAQLVQETTTYSYDNLNRLVQVVFNDGSTHDYVYDDLGNRIQLNAQLSIDSETLQNTITVYPNPTNGLLNIKIPDHITTNDNTTITIYDVNGRIINEIQPKGIDTEISIKVDELSNGTYILQLKTDNRQWSQIFIKK